MREDPHLGPAVAFGVPLARTVRTWPRPAAQLGILLTATADLIHFKH